MNDADASRRNVLRTLCASAAAGVGGCAGVGASALSSGRAAIGGGTELDHFARGRGEPVVLIHPGHFADWCMPLLAEPALTGRFRVLTYHRAGCAGSSPATGAPSIALQAAHCRSLMQRLGIERAHVVGHSSSGNVALQLALDAPQAVRSLALLEPALAVPGAPGRAFIAAALGHYRGGDRAAAIDTFLRGVCGAGYRAVLDRALPGAFAQHVADAATFFEHELPALQRWSFTPDEARRITAPVLAGTGELSPKVDGLWAERQALLLAWLPHAEPFVLPGATHLMQVQQPRAMAVALAAFFARHSLTGAHA